LGFSSLLPSCRFSVCWPTLLPTGRPWHLLLNIFVAGAMLYWSWKYATKAGLIKEDTPAEVRASICKRVFIAQSLYAAGAALCVFNTWSALRLSCWCS